MRPDHMLSRCAGRSGLTAVGLLLALVWSVLFLAAVAPSGARASEEPARASMVSEVSAIGPHEPVWLALTIELAPGWHTYWINPGDSGLPLDLTWMLPPGFRAGPPAYPVPERQPYGPIINYGYQDSVSFLVPITPPDQVVDGKSYDFSVRLNYLACAEICIPLSSDLSLSLPGRAAGSTPDLGEVGHFQRARALLPQSLPANDVVTVALAARGDDAGKVAYLSLPAVGQAAAGAAGAGDWYFFSVADDLLDHAGAQQIRHDRQGDRLLLRLPLSAAMAALPEVVQGVIASDIADSDARLPVRRIGYRLRLQPGPAGALDTAWQAAGQSAGLAAEPAPPQDAAPAAGTGGVVAGGLLLLLAFGFAGGMLLNLMPCVLPVLSLKLMALLREADVVHRAEKRRHAWAYAAGIEVTLLLLGGLMLALRASGAAIGWGFQLQNPAVVLVLAVLFFLLALGMLGLMPLPQLLGSAGSDLTRRQGSTGAFFTGVLAVAAASPCTVPFMASALGAALVLPWFKSLAIFLALGAGLAFPMVLIAHLPHLARWLPRPGIWMIRLQQLLSFPLFATVLWLIFIIGQQRGLPAVMLVLSVLLLTGFLVWLRAQLVPEGRGSGVSLSIALAVLFLVGLAGRQSLQLPVSGGIPVAAADGETEQGETLTAEPYSAARLAAARAAGQPVFINATAAWCLTCLVNERVVFSDPAVARAFRDRKVVYLKADWTNQDPEISALLERFGRIGVPLYVAYLPGRDQPVTLPQLLSPTLIIDTFSYKT